MDFGLIFGIVIVVIGTFVAIRIVSINKGEEGSGF